MPRHLNIHRSAVAMPPVLAMAGPAAYDPWRDMDAALVQLRGEGRRAVRIVDAGCGAGQWLVRLVLRARDLGFTAIEGRGIDPAPELIALARATAGGIADPRIGLRFDVADGAAGLAAEDDLSSDITLCLSGAGVPAAELERITDGELFVTQGWGQGREARPTLM